LEGPDIWFFVVGDVVPWQQPRVFDNQQADRYADFEKVSCLQ
jgi:hypothetical protein